MTGCTGNGGNKQRRVVGCAAFRAVARAASPNRPKRLRREHFAGRMSGLHQAGKKEDIITFMKVLRARDTSALQLREDRASEPDYYVLSPSSVDLDAISKEIAEPLSNLRIAH
jgi:hypothetical protein